MFSMLFMWLFFTTSRSEEEVPTFNTTIDSVKYLKEQLLKVNPKFKFRERLHPVDYITYKDREKRRMNELTNLAHAPTGNEKEGDYLLNFYYKINSDFTLHSDGIYTIIEFTVTPKYFTTADQEKWVDGELDRIYNESFKKLENSSDLYILRGLFEYTFKNFIYDWKDEAKRIYGTTYDLYNGLMNKKMVCLAYSKFLLRMCLRFGIDARIITVSFENSIGHAFNSVKAGRFYSTIDASDVASRRNKWKTFLVGGKDAYYSNESMIFEPMFTTPSYYENYPYNPKNVEYYSNIAYETDYFDSARVGKDIHVICDYDKNKRCWRLDVEGHGETFKYDKPEDSPINQLLKSPTRSRSFCSLNFTKSHVSVIHENVFTCLKTKLPKDKILPNNGLVKVVGNGLPHYEDHVFHSTVPEETAPKISITYDYEKDKITVNIAEGGAPGLIEFRNTFKKLFLTADYKGNAMELDVNRYYTDAYLLSVENPQKHDGFVKTPEPELNHKVDITKSEIVATFITDFKLENQTIVAKTINIDKATPKVPKRETISTEDIEPEPWNPEPDSRNPQPQPQNPEQQPQPQNPDQQPQNPQNPDQQPQNPQNPDQQQPQNPDQQPIEENIGEDSKNINNGAKPKQGKTFVIAVTTVCVAVVVALVCVVSFIIYKKRSRIPVAQEEMIP